MSGESKEGIDFSLIQFQEWKIKVDDDLLKFGRVVEATRRGWVDNEGKGRTYRQHTVRIHTLEANARKGKFIEENKRIAALKRQSESNKEEENV